MSHWTDGRDAVEKSVEDFKANHGTAFSRFVFFLSGLLIGMLLGHFG